VYEHGGGGGASRIVSGRRRSPRGKTRRSAVDGRLPVTPLS